MKHDEAKKIIQDCLESEYDATKFNRFIADVLTIGYKVTNSIFPENRIKESFRDSLSSYTVLGTYEDPTGKKIAILEVRLKSATSLQNARTMQRNFVADFLKGRNSYGRQDGALVAFVSPDGSDWRFSLVKMEYSPELQDGKLKITEDLTPARRWSFLVGKHEKSHTAQSRLLPLVKEESHGTTLAEIENAFDVERVTDEFFEQYKECFFRFKDEIDRVVASDSVIREHFESIGLDTANFAKKTLGQIAFLYFLQKKGWFGVPKSSDEWTGGNKEFLRKAFERHSKGEFGTKNFFNDILEPLFYTALNTDRINENYIYNFGNDFSYKIPFLNGGLFEPMKGYSWEKTDLTISDEIFSNTHTTKNGDIGWGIFDVFDRYNFTVSEDEPLEKEVAVDPEMLGKIFENLLEVRDRKSKGAFYTPRPIVHYMCQESLIEYLASTHLSISREDIEFFIRESERTLENDRTWKRKVDEKIAQSKQPYKGEYEHKTRVSIISNAQKLDDALAGVRIADPAVGSGAFPLGMINEIVRARQILAVHTGSGYTAYDLKLHAIQESIYGVDLDPGAVEICQLRLWLSLIVDEDEPLPLPNLNYRIVQGNSLIEEYEGIKLYDPRLLSSEKQKVEQMSMDSLVDSESNRLYELLQYKLKRFVETSGRTEKQHLKREIDDLKYGLIEATLREQNKEEKITEIRRLREANITPFFLWKMEFSEVFQEKGGFDIVIGNPPYGAQVSDSDKIIFKNNYFSAKTDELGKGSIDTFSIFTDLAISKLTKEKGVLSYILPMSVTSSESMTKLHQLILGSSSYIYISSYSDRPKKIFMSAETACSILILRKGKSDNTKLMTTKVIKRYSEEQSIDEIIKNLNFIDAIEFTEDGRIPKIGQPIEQDILRIIKKSNIRLSNYLKKEGVGFYYRSSGGRYYKIITNFSTGSSKEKSFFIDQKFNKVICAIFSTNLYFWYYHAYSNNLDLKTSDIEIFPMPDLSKVNTETMNLIGRIYDNYVYDLEKNSEIQIQKRAKVSEVKTYYARKSKPMIDELDRLIGPIFGLDQEQVEWIINFDLRFRIDIE